MPNITFLEPGGGRRDIVAKVGESVMQAATRNGVKGIIGECGGSCMCATCHCYIDDASTRLVVPATDNELETLEFVAREVRPESRLTCQIGISEALDGLVLTVVGE